jgi:hypothetical protein
MLQAEHGGAESDLMECAPPLLVVGPIRGPAGNALSGNNRLSVVAALANYTRYLLIQPSIIWGQRKDLSSTPPRFYTEGGPYIRFTPRGVVHRGQPPSFLHYESG